MRRLSKTKIELEKILKANAKQGKMARGAKTPAGVRENQLLPSNNWAIELDGDADSWVKSFGSLLKLREAANDPENLELFANLLDTEHAIDGIRKILVDNFFDGNIEEKLMLMWYPDGTVTSKEQWTTGLKYTEPDENGNVMVKPFTKHTTLDDSDADNSNKEGEVIIPPYIEDGGIKRMVVGVERGTSLAKNNQNLTSIKAPTTIKSIKKMAFYHCIALESISFPSVQSIDEGAFVGCTSLESVSLPAVITLAGGENGGVFAGCTALKSIELRQATTIGMEAFSGCTSLKSVYLPVATRLDSGEYNGPFTGCTGLESIALPAVTHIGSDSFNNCNSLKNIVIPAVTWIGTNAFRDCSSLESIDFGNTLADIPRLGYGSVFYNVPDTCKFFIPHGLLNQWQSASGWSNLSFEIIENPAA